jgi:hypothetical protein
MSERARTKIDTDMASVKGTVKQLTANAKANWASGITLIQQLPKDFMENRLEFLEGGAELLLKGVDIGAETTIYERVMSEAELNVTLKGEGKNLLRGGREGENFFSKEGTISNDAKRAQQRLGLDGKLRDYKVKFSIDDPTVKVSGPRTAKAGTTGTAGGGLEYSTNQTTRIKIRSVSKLKNKG